MPTCFGARAASDDESTMRNRCCSKPSTYQLVLLRLEGVPISRDKNKSEIESSGPGNSSPFEPLQATSVLWSLRLQPHSLDAHLRNVLQRRSGECVKPIRDRLHRRHLSYSNHNVCLLQRSATDESTLRNR